MCSNCDDPVENHGKQGCKVCGRDPPEWLLRGLTMAEYIIEVQAAHGYDVTELNKALHQRRAATREAAGGGKATGEGGGGSGPGGDAARLAAEKAENAKHKATVAVLQAWIKRQAEHGAADLSWCGYLTPGTDHCLGASVHATLQSGVWQRQQL